MLSRIKSILRQRKYRLFIRPYELNIVGIRSKNSISNRFDDELHIFYKTTAGIWNYHIYKATTDPGTYWLNNPASPQGTAVLAQGQYADAYKIDLHQGKYLALCQRLKPVTIIRDYDRNDFADFMNGTKVSGMFGINIHRANSVGRTKNIDKYSSGCQVFENENDFEEFMQFCDRHQKLYKNVFTYTLLDFRAVRRENIRRIIIGTFTLGLGLIGYYNYEQK